MRNTTFLTFLELAACIWRAHAQGCQTIPWIKETGYLNQHASDITVCPANYDQSQDTIWATRDTSRGLGKIHLPGGNWHSAGYTFPWREPALSKISARSSSEWWAVNTAGDILINGEADTEVRGTPPKMKQVSIAHDGTVWAVGVDGYPYHRLDYTWVKQDVYRVKMVSVGKIDVVWAVGDDDKIWYRDFSLKEWIYVPGRLKWLDVSKDGDVWGVNSANEIFYWLPGTKSWQKVCGKLRVISNSGRYVAGLGPEGQGAIYYYKKTNLARASGFEVDASNEQVFAAGSASLIILIVLAGVALLGCVFALLFCMRRRSRKKRKKNESASVKGNSDDEDEEADDVDFHMEIELETNDNTTSAMAETLVESNQSS